MSYRPGTLAEVLAPVSTSTFIEQFFGKKFFYTAGQRGRFAGLLPWSDLNQILRHHRLDAPRLRLVLEGKTIPPASYVTYQTSRRRPDLSVPRLRSVDLTRHLRSGATLIVDAVDEIQESITELAEDIESVLACRIQVNMYAGWRHSPGFDLHWDDHDVLILQVSGRKEWKVYPMTREYPTAADPEGKGAPPSAPLWEGTLNDGDLLYIPRGWWHVAVPVDEPTLHLTVGIHNKNGMDLLSWFTERLRGSASLRQDLPRFATEAQKTAHMERIREVWNQAWHSEILHEYFASVDARAQGRPNFSLPWSATPGILPPGESSWTVRWSVPRHVDISSDGGTLEIASHGKVWTFAKAARPLITLLQDKRTCSLQDLYEVAADGLDPHVVRTLVKELCSAGLVTVASDGPHA